MLLDLDGIRAENSGILVSGFSTVDECWIKFMGYIEAVERIIFNIYVIASGSLPVNRVLDHHSHEPERGQKNN